MLGGVRLKVSLTHERTCFAYISPKYSANKEQSQCIQILYKEKQILLWAVFSSNVSEGYISCNPTHSKLLDLDEGAEVFVSPYGDVPVLDELYIDTESPDDQEILEHNADILQYRILDQLRLVVSHQKAVVWISTSLPIVFTPKQTGLLVNHSKILVKVDVFNKVQNQSKTLGVSPQNNKHAFNNIGLINQGILQPYLFVPNRLVLRALAIDSDGKKGKNIIHPYTVFIHEDLIGSTYKDFTVILATMQNIPSISNLSNRNEDENETTNTIDDLCVEIVPVDNVIFRSLSHEVYNKNIPSVLIPKSLNAIINIENGMKIIFTLIGDNAEQPEHIDVITYTDKTQTEIDIIEKFKKCVVDNTHSGKQFLINNNIVKQNNQITNGFLRFKLKPEQLKYTMLNSESFRHCSVSAKSLTDADLELPKHVPSKLEYDFKSYCRSMRSMQNIVEKVVANIYFEIHREACFKGVSEIKSNILITGASGSGKTSLCHLVQKDLTLWSHVLHCRPLKGRKDIPEVLSKAILICQEHSPSVLICDDFDALVSPNMEGDSPQDISFYQRLAICIKNMLQSCSGVCVIMTSLSMHSLHPVLREFGGKPLFTSHFDVPELDQDERVELFKHLLNSKVREAFVVENDDVIRMAMDTAGSNVRDVVDYLNKKIFKAIKKKKSPTDKPRLNETTKETPKELDIWTPVGGLEDVKRQLTEAIFWPIMYPVLFPSKRCGVMLYGPPGTGKSHLGSCLARAVNMRMLTVKGPELLSKYIGQSEKAVRDIFDKAELQRPCILFFDEFDSLAPKRGHDSTGVTDRVVNQLLARLDGAEGGAKGPVVVATSRPDLVDPALLRAGRIERHIYCALPDLKDRQEVLKTLAQNVTVDESVDFQLIAEKTEGFSPADLKSLLVTAQLGRLETQLMSSEGLRMESVVVNGDDIEIALRETKPSLSMEQRNFYDMIYKRFRGDHLSSEQKMISQQMLKQRVTLA
ncbi:peroxisome biogenesis factor 1 isoform X1 [Pieris brassicae]|uniref:peroxisome biogenesis factor 1 isoform X1 n=2 Tax=Pieris brassicae TaxID=7116 RepID=UPI001E65E814|nr:peroxisome biogenesis factor 1 isoform X1 [Pieris brassicae]